jgi:WD40 repeat protein
MYVEGKGTVTPLRFSDQNTSLLKPITVNQLVTVQNGGSLVLEHGNASGTATDQVYANLAQAPFNVYKIDPNNPDNPVLAGQLAFKTKAIAMHPFTGKVFYTATSKTDGVCPVGVWDPETNTNTVLPGGPDFVPVAKLAFHPDGRLFCLPSNNRKRLYTIDTVTGNATLYNTLSEALGLYGDMVFSPDGILFSTGGSSPKLKVSDIDAGTVAMYSIKIGPLYVNGLSFGRDGTLYYVSKPGDVGIIDLATGAGTEIGSTGISEIKDTAPVIAHTELAYAYVNLQVLPGAIDQDTEFSLNIETTELVGGVAVTFGPHGTVFNQPAILNLEARGVDFTGVDPDGVDVYYDNTETNQWELMDRDDVIVDAFAGTVQVINARLPHFSRYAVAFAN